jgi:HD-like signal output (HDOD) protein
LLLRATLDRLLDLGSLIGEPGLKRRLSRLVAPPVSYGLLSEVGVELGRPTPSLRRLGELVECDPGLSAKVLQLAHCAYVGLAGRVHRPSQAVALLGEEQLRGVLQGMLSHHLLQDAGLGAPSHDERAAWEHALVVAVEAQRLAKGMGPELEGLAFTAGIVHDLGALVLSTLEPEAWSLTGGRDDSAAETAACGASHSAAGAYLLGLWGLPDAVVEAVAAHHADTPGRAALARVLAAAEARVDGLGKSAEKLSAAA